MRILLGGLVAGVILFVWGTLAHMALPLGSAGIRVAENEDQVLLALKQTIPRAGMYLLPGMDPSVEPTPELEKAWEEKYRQGPTALLLFDPYGSEPMAGDRFLLQFFSQLACGILAAFLLGRMTGGSFGRLLCVPLFGLFAWFSIQVPMWIWYGFPGQYAMAQAVYLLVGWFLAGLALVRVVKPASRRP